jgi:hypothetical protein
MAIALTILKAAIVITGVSTLIIKLPASSNDNKLRIAFKIIGITFLILTLITVVEFVLAISF